MKRSAAAFAAFLLAATAAQGDPRPQLAGPQAPAPQASSAIRATQHGNPAPQGSAADLLFQQGEFEQARAAYQAVPKSSPLFAAAQRQLGAIALYQNHPAEAEALLTRARTLNPADKRTLALLAETMQREGRFADMAQMLHQLGNPVREAEFQIFGKATPYRMPAHQGTATISFQWTDPLPVVLAKVNGFEGLFLVDTGAPEIILDPGFALYAHVQSANAPGKQAPGPISFGRVSQFSMTGVETDDVPVMVLSTRGLSKFARNKRIAGVIGTEFLSHFRPTLDYIHDRLVLEPLDAPTHSSGSTEVPFWLVGDHFVLAQGRLDQGPKQMFLVDTGVAGTTFAAAKSTLLDAGIPVPVPQGPAKNAIGVPPTALFPISRLSLGALTQTKLSGHYGPFPPALEGALGVHIGGLVSHGFFAPYAVTFDFVRMTIGFHK
jgi:hypothetical protein